MRNRRNNGLGSVKQIIDHFQGLKKLKASKVTLETVRKSYKHSVMRTFPITSRWIGRPLADLLAVPLHNVGLTANSITGFRILLYFVSILILFVPNYTLTVCGALGLLTAFVLDFVDGHLARLRNEASFFGKFVAEYDGFGRSIYKDVRYLIDTDRNLFSFQLDKNYFVGLNEGVLAATINRPLQQVFNLQEIFLDICKENYNNIYPLNSQVVGI